MFRMNRATILSGLTLTMAQVAVTAAPVDPPSATAQFRMQHGRVGVLTENGLVTNLHGPAFSHGGTSAASVEAFLEKHVQIFGVTRAALAAPRIQPIMRGKFTAYSFEQQWNGTEVDGAGVTLLVLEEADHPLVLVTARTFVLPDDLGGPVLNAVAAQKIAAQAVPALTGFEPAKLVVYPRSTPPVLAWFFWADSPKGPNYERWGFYVDAVNGTILEKRDGILHEDISGTVTGKATPGTLPDEPDNPPVELPVYGARVFIEDGEEAFVEPDGSYFLPHDGNSRVNVELDLSGRWCRVLNQSPATVALTALLNVRPPGPADFSLNGFPTELDTAQLNAIIHTTLIHDFVKEIIPDFDFIDLPIPTLVNINNICNAFYTLGAPSLNFFTSQSGPQPHCPNTANSTVIYHEYGHFIIDMGSRNPTADYHEGVADAIAGLLVNSECMAPGFGGQDQGCLRNIDEPDFVAPVGHPDPHCSGLAIAGAFWDLRTELIDRLGESEGLALALELMYNQILVGPGEITSEVTITVLTIDDDDADILNGTPNYLPIQRAFSAHGMPGPSLVLLEFAYPEGFPANTSPLIGARFPVDIANGTAGVVLDESDVALHFSTDGESFINVPLGVAETSPDGAGYEAILPAGDCFGTVYWYISAGTQPFGDIVTDPPGAPGSTHVAPVATTAMTILQDDFETDLGWTVEIVPFDDPFKPGGPDLTTGGWERAVPDEIDAGGGGGACDPSPPTLVQPGSGFGGGQGELTFVTGPLGGEGTGAFDVDWGPVRLLSPLLEVPRGVTRFSYARWFYNDDGDDSMIVEVSNDGGESWTTVEVVGGQTGWVEVEHDLSEFVQPTDRIVFRFSTGDDPNNSITEACVDEFQLVTLVCATADADGDGDADWADFAEMQICFTGSDAGPISPGCEVFDFDLDNDVDVIDFMHFINAATGPR
ncbi:MAG: hypothetical protein V3W34_13865 [Phycisphaerae bacterium]